jgi:hypothetical protein
MCHIRGMKQISLAFYIYGIAFGAMFAYLGVLVNGLKAPMFLAGLFSLCGWWWIGYDVRRMERSGRW